MRFARTGLMLVALVALGACASKEYVPPLKPVGEGVPKDLPALAEQDFAALRLTING